MQTLLDIIKEKVTKACLEAFSLDSDFVADVTVCLNEEFGHYQCNSSLQLAKIVKKNPHDIAKEIIENLKDENIFSRIDIKGPGFINFFLDKDFLSKEIEKIKNDSYLGADISKKKKIVIDFSSPNVAKDLHVGHLRSTIIGDSISRCFEFLENDVLRLNHIGDWGTQFGMLIAYMKEYQKNVIEGKKESDLTSLVSWYKKSKKKFDEDEIFKKRSQEEVVKLQNGNENSKKVWETICQISKKSYDEIYDLLDVKINERGESFYNDRLKGVVEDLEKKDFITISDGAKCVFLDGFKARDGSALPYMVQKSDGGFNYDTTDLAAMRQRIEEEKANRIIIITDAGQSLHFKMLYALCVKAGYLDPKKVIFNHVPFGLVLGKDKKKLKTREGETEKLIDLLYGAIDRAQKMIKLKNPDIDKKELENLSKVLGIGAVKYADLSCHRQKDYQFSYDRMLKFEGNTAVFLIYSYVRIMGIKRNLKNIKESQIELKHQSEIALALHLRRFSEVLEIMTKELLPNRLTEYLYSLAEKFNAFFRDCKVVGDENQDARWQLCSVTSKILKQGLFILGIDTVDKM